MDATYEQMLIDFWAWAHFEDPKLRHELFVNDDFASDLAEMEADALAREVAQAAAIASVPEGDWEDV